MPIVQRWCQRSSPIRFCLTGAAPDSGTTRGALCAAPLRQKRSSLYYILPLPKVRGPGWRPSAGSSVRTFSDPYEYGKAAPIRRETDLGKLSKLRGRKLGNLLPHRLKMNTNTAFRGLETGYPRSKTRNIELATRSMW